MSRAFSRALSLGLDLKQFPLGKCSPSDDPEKQTAYLYAFLDLAKPFVAAVKRVGDSELSALVIGLDLNPKYIEDAYALKADLQGAIDYLEDVSEDETYGIEVKANTAFVDPSVLAALRSVEASPFDLAKLVRYCEELNDAYGRANFLSCALLIRAVLNHVPPIFGHQTFSQVVAQSPRSLKAILGRLEDGARVIADLHSHSLIRKREPLPTKHQIEPFKAPFELLIQDIISAFAKETPG